MSTITPKVAVHPTTERAWLVDAVVAGGADVVPIGDAEALVWADPARPQELAAVLAANPGIQWVQLPWAGIEPYLDVLDHERVWTCGKGVYAEPVAEHALALLLAGLRGLPQFARRGTWSVQQGTNLLGADVTILGAGGITTSLLRLLAPFGCRTTVVRRTDEPLEGADEVLPVTRLHEVLPGTDALVLALALTPDTVGVVGAAELALLPAHAWIVNVARGEHVDTAALVGALAAGDLGGAALDVTSPEPLPDGHPLWGFDNVLVTPHTANTPEMAVPLLSQRVTENVRRFRAGTPLVGTVDVDAGY